jgi:preprotein translocase subunit YajC
MMMMMMLMMMMMMMMMLMQEPFCTTSKQEEPEHSTVTGPGQRLLIEGGAGVRGETDKVGRGMIPYESTSSNQDVATVSGGG